MMSQNKQLLIPSLHFVSLYKSIKCMYELCQLAGSTKRIQMFLELRTVPLPAKDHHITCSVLQLHRWQTVGPKRVQDWRTRVQHDQDGGGLALGERGL